MGSGHALRALSLSPLLFVEHEVDYEALTDDQVLQFVGRGESWALAVLYDRYARLVFSLAFKMLNEPRLAEEVVQEVFFKVWRGASSFQPRRGKFSSWLIGITHNQCVDELRRKHARPIVELGEDSLASLASEGDDPLSIAARNSEHARALQALSLIPPDQRTVIEMAFYQGLTHREIAARLELPLGTVKTRLRLGLLKMRELLHGQSDS